MTWTWFKIFNLSEFNATGLVSRTYTVVFDGIGQKDILVTKGNLVGVTYDGVYLGINLNDQNPFELEGLKVYVEPGTNDVYLGIASAS